ncbi:MAG: type II toxin-antitoxin system RelE/ParE family toxin [Candidatus Margulisiibacteriota bacterium]
MIKVVQTSRFERVFKKYYPKVQVIIRDEIRLIASNPEIGEKKHGDIADVRVHKFKIKTDLYLLAYQHLNGELIVLEFIQNSHENFYENLKKGR